MKRAKILLWSTRRNNEDESARSGPTRTSSLSVLASDFQVTGDLRCSGELHIDGIINGNVWATKVTVGHTGTVIGKLEAAEIVICGTVHGIIRGGSVVLARSARLHAEILHDGVTVTRAPDASAESDQPAKIPA